MNTTITLFCVGENGFRVLESLVSEFTATAITQVVSGRDAGVENDYFEETSLLCKKEGISFVERTKQQTLESEYSLAVGWKWLLPLNKPLVVLHNSLLPRYRGFCPIVSALIDGDPKLGVTAILASERYDEGPILFQEEIGISYPITIKEAFDLLIPAYQSVAKKVFTAIAHQDSLQGTPQDSKLATYSLWRDEEDYRIDWNRTAAEIKRFVDAVGSPYAGASCFVKGEKIRILECEECEDVFVHNRTPGKIIFLDQGYPVVICREGLLRITKMVCDQKGVTLLPHTGLRTRFE